MTFLPCAFALTRIYALLFLDLSRNLFWQEFVGEATLANGLSPLLGFMTQVRSTDPPSKDRHAIGFLPGTRTSPTRAEGFWNLPPLTEEGRGKRGSEFRVYPNF